MMAQRAVWISVCLVGVASVAGAQDRLSLTDATKRALEKNHAIRIEREMVTGANLGVSISQIFETAGVMTVSVTTARENTNNIYYLCQPAYFTSLGVELQQTLLRSRALEPARTALRVTALDRDRSGAVLAH